MADNDIAIKLQRRKHYLKYREKILSKNRERRISNKEKYQAAQRKRWAEQDPEKKKRIAQETYQRRKVAGCLEDHAAWRKSPEGKAYLKEAAKRASMRYKERNPLERLARKLAGYGLTVKQYDKIFTSQKGLCAICKRPETELFNKATHGELKKSLTIDHHHETGAVRGLLCGRCNKAIGLLNDSAKIVFAAAQYLERFGLFARISNQGNGLCQIQKSCENGLGSSNKRPVNLA